MSDLDPAPADFDGLPAYLVGAVPGFASSAELEALGDGRGSARHVGAALGRYLMRLQAKAVRREADAVETAALDRAYAVLEELAASDDPQVRALLAGEILERLRGDDVVVAVVETRLGPRARPLFRRWAV